MPSKKKPKHKFPKVSDTKEEKIEQKKHVTEVIPKSTKVEMKPEIVKKFIDKILFEREEVIKEKSDVVALLSEDNSVRYRFQEARKAYAYQVGYTDYPYPDCSNIPGIIIPTAVDGARANIVEAFDIDPPFTSTQEPDSDIKTTQEKYLQHKLRNGIESAEEEIISSAHNALLLGVGIFQHFDRKILKGKRKRGRYKNVEEFLAKYPVDKYPELLQRLQNGEEVNMMERINPPKDEYRNIVRWVDPSKFLIRKHFKRAKDANFVGEDIDYTVEEILEEDFDNLNNIVSEADIENIYTSERVIETTHAEIEFDPEDGKGKRKLMGVVERGKKECLMAIEFPYDHESSTYIDLFVQPFEGSYWRQGLYDKLKGIHFTHKELIDLILNSAYITYIPSFKTLKRGGVDTTKKDWYPGVVWRLKNLDDLVQFDVRPSSLQLDNFIDVLRQMGFEQSGVSPYTQGAPSSAGESGRKVAILLTAGGMRLKEMIKHMKPGLNELAYQIMAISEQRFKKKQSIFVDGKTEVIEPEIFRGSSNSYISTLDIKNAYPDVVLERNILIANILKDNQIVMSNPDAIREIGVQILQSARMGWEERINKIFPTQEELKQKQIEITKAAIKQIQEEQEVTRLGEKTGEKLQQGLNAQQGGLPPLGEI